MKYSKIYNSIVQRAKNRTTLQIYESHHIIPKCLGGANNKSNVVKLTPREHFICHLLLTKMYKGEERQKMWFAYYRLSNRLKQTNSRFYEKAKHNVKLELSKIHSGKTISDEHKKAIREKCRGMVGKKHAPAAIEQMRKAKIGNNHARVGVDVLEQQSSKILYSLNSIAELCTNFDLTRGQAEHYIYKKVPFNNMLFVRQKIITRS